MSPSGFDDPRYASKPVSRNASFGGYDQVGRDTNRSDNWQRDNRRDEGRKENKRVDNRHRDSDNDRQKNVRHGQV